MDNRGDDENFEEIGNPLFLPAEHPLQNNQQNALNTQLSDEYERVHLEFLDKSNTLKKIEKEKEDVGVQLYGQQQQLADMQLSFENAHESYNNVQRIREDNEKRLTSLSENLEFRQKEIEELRKKVVRATDELSRLNLSLKQVEAYNQAMKKEIKKTKRVTHTAEENIGTLENQKKIQDQLIDQMNEEIKRLNEQRAILGAQLQAQAEETENAKRILRDAQTEMDKILASKKNQLEHWQKAIFEIQEKDKNQQIIKESLKIQAELNIKITSEMNGIEKEIDNENENSAVVASIFEKLKKEERNLDDHSRKLIEKRDKIEAKIAILRSSLRSTEEEIKRIATEQKTLEDQVDLIENNIMKLHTETKKKMDEIINKVSEHKTIEKTSANQLRQGNTIANEVSEKQIELENLDNEMARVKLDILNTESQLIMLENRRREVNKEREEKENLVTKYENKIRENHDTHEKKMYDVAKYNREHDKASQKQNVFSKGPSEANLIHLKKETIEQAEQCKKLQGEFIKEQTLYVKKEIQCNEINEQIAQLMRKETILEQKKIRLNGQYMQHKKEIKRIQNAIENFENDMRKLNNLLALNYEAAKNFQNANINVNSEFIEKLKELEKESVKLEVEIDRLKESKAELLSDIVEAERQILQWERKIQLEKEMQEQLDPNVGQHEIKNLKKQIHIMELQLDDIRKKQDQLIIEIERSVYKRVSFF